MDNNIQVFENQTFGNVRVTVINNEPWFVGRDVADSLGYGNASKAVMMHVDEDDKMFSMMDIADSQNGNVPMGQSKTAFINESGLYSLVMSSKLPTAKKFKKWVTSEVLPSIRKHGAYMTGETIDSIIANPDNAIRIFTALKEERAARKEAEHELEEQAPKVLFANAVIGSSSSCIIGELAKIISQNGYSIGQNRLFKWLRENHYLGSKGEFYNIPNQQYVEQGLFEIKKRTISGKDGVMFTTCTTKVTGKGQVYFVNKFLHMDKQES